MILIWNNGAPHVSYRSFIRIDPHRVPLNELIQALTGWPGSESEYAGDGVVEGIIYDLILFEDDLTTDLGRAVDPQSFHLPWEFDQNYDLIYRGINQELADRWKSMAPYLIEQWKAGPYDLNDPLLGFEDLKAVWGMEDV